MRDIAAEAIDSAVSRMLEELAREPEFMSSRFWQDIGARNMEMLRSQGVGSFKRTVANNYYNWMVSYRNDPQFKYRWNEWKRHPSLSSFGFRFESDLAYQTTMHAAPTSLGRKEAWLYGLFVSLGWDIALRNDPAGYLQRLEEPLVGNPIRLRRGGRLISQDLANSAVECNLVAGLRPTDGRRFRVAELGAGHGRLAHVFLSQERGQYMIFDIPPALYVSEWYLRQVLPNCRIFGFRPFRDWSEVADEVEQADLAFFTANQIRRLPSGYCDVTLTISTLPEMRPGQVDLYLSEFDRITRGHIFLKQWKSWKNPHDGTELNIDYYNPGPRWRVALDRTDPLNPLFFNRVLSA